MGLRSYADVLSDCPDGGSVRLDGAWAGPMGWSNRCTIQYTRAGDLFRCAKGDFSARDILDDILTLQGAGYSVLLEEAQP